MSTISDALKKAQQQRAVRGPERLAPPLEPVPRPELSPRRVEAREISSTPSVAWRVAAIVAVVLGVSIVVMWWGMGGGQSVKRGAQREEREIGRGGNESGSRESGKRIAEGGKVESKGEEQGIGVSGGRMAGGGEPSALVATKAEQEKAAEVVEDPVMVPEPAGPMPKLVGIFYSEKNPVAIIDGFSMKEGETVGGYVVEKILSESVVLKTGVREIVLRMK